MIILSRCFSYRVQGEKEIKQLCNKFNTCEENILRNNVSLPLYEGEYIKIKVNDYTLHIVKPMETLVDISKTYNIAIEKIKLDNNLMSEKLFIGQRIKIYQKNTT